MPIIAVEWGVEWRWPNTWPCSTLNVVWSLSSCLSTPRKPFFKLIPLISRKSMWIDYLVWAGWIQHGVKLTQNEFSLFTWLESEILFEWWCKAILNCEGDVSSHMAILLLGFCVPFPYTVSWPRSIWTLSWRNRAWPHSEISLSHHRNAIFILILINDHATEITC